MRANVHNVVHKGLVNEARSNKVVVSTGRDKWSDRVLPQANTLRYRSLLATRLTAAETPVQTPFATPLSQAVFKAVFNCFFIFLMNGKSYYSFEISGIFE
jgi:hypothetical protein